MPTSCYFGRRRLPTTSMAGSSSATTDVIAHAFSGSVSKSAFGRKAFVNFDRRLLTGTCIRFCRRRISFLEVLETVEADPEVLAACRDLRKRGTRSLSTTSCAARDRPLTVFAQMIKVDVQATSQAEQDEDVARYQAPRDRDAGRKS